MFQKLGVENFLLKILLLIRANRKRYQRPFNHLEDLMSVKKNIPKSTSKKYCQNQNQFLYADNIKVTNINKKDIGRASAMALIRLQN